MHQSRVFISKQESDVEASFSSHDSDEDGTGPSFGAKRFKREITAEDVFEENGNRNGTGSPMNEHEMMDVALNGNHSNDMPREGKGLFLHCEELHID